jgi:hypothetical protein
MESSRQPHTADASAAKHRQANLTAESPEVAGASGVAIPGLAGMQTTGAPLLSPDQVIPLQRIVGNRTLTGVISRRIQRHPEGKALPRMAEQVGEIQGKAAAAPAATRTKEQEATQQGEAKQAGSAFQKAQKLTPGAMSLAGAQKILQGAFGGVKDIVPGSVVILPDQPACAAKYDEVCIADGVPRPDGSAWQKGDLAKDDAAAGTLTQGFAWKGVAYVNGQTTLVTATAHEILRNNTAAGFRDNVGETFNEGITELLARRALSMAGVNVPTETAYPDQVKFSVRLQNVVGQPVIADAYFGGAASLVNRYEQLKGANTWATLKTAAEALDETAFNQALAAKKA